MFDRQTKKFCSAVVDALPSDISPDVMQGWISSPTSLRNVLKRVLCPPEEMEMSPLLKLIIITRYFPYCDRFSADKLFDAPGIRVSGEFREVFSGKIEKNVLVTAYRIHKLTRPSQDEINEGGSPGIIAELNGRKEFHLCHLRTFLREQTRNWFIFYIRDKEGKLWAASASRADDVWYLSVCPVGNSRDWPAGFCVVSRKAA